MKVFCLSGKSGTGKSYRALDLCEEYKIDAIIDDGLLIFNGRIIAGKSAKRQSTKIKAIKTALIQEDKHKDEIIQTLRANHIKSVLIIGTSEKMVKLILERLELPKPEKMIDIESITTQEERDIAYLHRNDLGEHIIPAPTMEIKKVFSGYFIHPLRRFREFYPESKWGGKKISSERSVVRPTYSYLGRFFISDKTITDIINIIAAEIKELDSVSDLYIKTKPDGMEIEIGIIVRYGFSITSVAAKLQKKVAEMVDEMTSLNLLSVDVKIESLMWDKDVRNN